jgi:hypothetical protein
MNQNGHKRVNSEFYTTNYEYSFNGKAKNNEVLMEQALKPAAKILLLSSL